MAETSTKPYMIRALYEWCCDNGYTPYLAVSVDEHTLVPRQHVKGGEIVLNVSPMATSRLSLGNELVEFQARFNGVAQQISIPVGNVSAIYSRETGQGMAFEVSRQVSELNEDKLDEERTDEGGLDKDEAGGSEAGRSGAGRKEAGRIGFGKDGTDETESGAGPRPSGDESARHAPGSTVQPLRAGARRRGPRRMELEGTGGVSDLAAQTHPSSSDAGQGRHNEVGKGRDLSGSGGEGDSATGDKPVDAAANSRKRAVREQGSADVLAFAPSADSAKKKGGNASGSKRGPTNLTTQVAEETSEGEDPPPADGGGKGGKARLTRVK